jgi:hypothetical protein
MLLSAHDSHTRNTDTEQIVIETGTIKLSKNVHADTKTGNKCIVGYIEAHYNKAKKYRTREMKLYEGSTFGIPFNLLLNELSLHICIQDKDEETTTVIGVGMIDFSYIKSTKLSKPVESYTKITNGTDKIGKITYCIRKVSIFADGTTNEKIDSKSDKDRIEELNVLYPLPSFQFHRLCRPVHWERLKGLYTHMYTYIHICILVRLLKGLYTYVYVYTYICISEYSIVFVKRIERDTNE